VCQLQAMMAENETMAQIERLSRHEFDLDVEEQKKLQAQCEVEVQKVTLRVEVNNKFTVICILLQPSFSAFVWYPVFCDVHMHYAAFTPKFHYADFPVTSLRQTCHP